FTQTQYRMVFQKSKELRGGLRPDQVSPEKLRELLTEMERLGRKSGPGGSQAPWAGDVAEGMEAPQGRRRQGAARRTRERAAGRPAGEGVPGRRRRRRGRRVPRRRGSLSGQGTECRAEGRSHSATAWQ